MFAALLFLLSAQDTFRQEYVEQTTQELSRIVGTTAYQNARQQMQAADPVAAFRQLGNAAVAAEDDTLRNAYVTGMTAIMGGENATNASREAYLTVAGEIAPNLQGEARYRLLYQRAVCAQDLGRVAVANEEFQALAAEVGDPASFWYFNAIYGMAQNNMSSGDYRSASTSLEELYPHLDAYPDSLRRQLAFQMVNTYAQIEQWPRLAAVGARLLSSLDDPEHRMNVLHHLGNAYYQMGQYRQSQEAYSELAAMLKKQPAISGLDPQLIYGDAERKATDARLLAEAEEMASTPPTTAAAADTAPPSQVSPLPPSGVDGPEGAKATESKPNGPVPAMATPPTAGSDKISEKKDFEDAVIAVAITLATLVVLGGAAWWFKINHRAGNCK